MKANLAMTLKDHIAIGGTPRQELVANPTKTLEGTMDDETLLAFVQKEVETVRQVHQSVKGGDSNQEKLLEIVRDDFLLPNIAYLREIGRLPEEFAEINFEKEFAT